MAENLAPAAGRYLTLIYSLANPTVNATSDLTFAQSGAGFKVPSGFDFIPDLLHLESNADLTAGTWTGKVIDDGTEISDGPEPALNDTVQVAVAQSDRHGQRRILSGSIVGVSVTLDASAAPSTADADAVLTGWLVPAEPS